VTAAGAPGRISRTERIARAAAGMPGAVHGQGAPLVPTEWSPDHDHGCSQQGARRGALQDPSSHGCRIAGQPDPQQKNMDGTGACQRAGPPRERPPRKEADLS
jgi:hypothetical protein